MISEKGNDFSHNIIVVGAGGHAKVCIEILHAMGKRVAYCIGSKDASETCLGVPVLKGNHHLKHLHEDGYTHVFVAIGSNTLREKLANEAMANGYTMLNAISPSAVVSPSVVLGNGIAIMAGAVINAEARIADFAIINTGATVDHDGQVGQAVHIGPQCALAGEVTIGDRSFLGIGCKVIPKVKIGENVILGAGSTVITNIESHCTAVGVPAQIIKKRTRVYEKDIRCPA